MGKGISLDKFAKGGLKAVFNREMQRTTSNICDPNTEAKTKRTITLTIEIYPDEDRQLGKVEVKAKSNLAPTKSLTTKMVFGYNSTEKCGEYSELNTEMLGQVDLEQLEETVKENAERLSQNVVDLQQKAN